MGIVLLSFSACSVVAVYFDGSCGLLCGLLLLFVLFWLAFGLLVIFLARGWLFVGTSCFCCL